MSRLRCRWPALVVSLTALSIAGPEAHAAAPGDLDKSFDTDGKATPSFGRDALGVAIQADGKIVTAGTTGLQGGGNFGVARFNANGSLDTSFSGDGLITTDFGPASAAEAVAIQSDGDIVVAGAVYNGDPSWDFAIAVYNSNGSLDTGFSSNGLRAIDFDGSYDWARGVAIQADDKIVVGGDANIGGDTDFAVVRLSTSGSLDSTFSSDGKATTGFGDFEHVNDVAIQTDGKIVAAGYGPVGSNTDFLLARYNTNGSPDFGFNIDGKLSTPFGGGDVAYGVALQADGKIVAAGSSYDFDTEDRDFALARYTTSGFPDSSFDSDGKLTTSVYGDSAAADVAIQANGRIVAAGFGTAFGEQNFAVARFTSTGSLDTSFSLIGVANTNMAFDRDDHGEAVAIQANGKIVVAGGRPGFGLARYHAVTDNPPNTVIDSGPSGTTSDSTPTFTFHSTESGSTLQCSVDTGSFQACTSPRTTSPLADGSHTFRVRAIDSAVQTDSTPATRSFTVDTTPDTFIDTGPSGPTADSTPTFSFHSTETGSTFECAIDDGDFGRCSSPRTIAMLSDGPHTFRVRAVDADGLPNTDATPAERSFSVDTVPPDTLIDSGPTGTISDPTPTFAFHSTEAGTFTCAIDTGPFQSCSSPRTTAPLADGPHTFLVRAADGVGNADLTPAERSFSVDTAPPDTLIDSGPTGPTNDPTPTFGFHSTEVGSTFECSIDGAELEACATPYTAPTSLDDGPHTFRVQATDSTAHTDPLPAERSFTVDTVPPDTAIVSGPSGAINRQTARFRFDALGEAAASFECKLDGRPWRGCGSPAAYRGLDRGRHRFRVRAIDVAGNRDPTPASRRFRVVSG